jgi:adenine-specific DNA-methyltransferase
MSKSNKIRPLKNELPTDFADRIGIHYTSLVTAEHKKENGQFFTPTPIARFMGNLASTTRRKVNILDPGCGTAILSCGLIESLIAGSEKLNNISLVAYETDEQILPFTYLSLNYLATWLKEREIGFRYKIVSRDFITENAKVFQESEAINLFEESELEKFDFIISNPPYFKLSKEDIRTKVSESIVSGQPNIYAFFMGVAAKLLNADGQFVFITPRSFASGSYFRAFREFFFKSIKVELIHLFVSRRNTFNRDKVLQEILILKGSNSISDNCESMVRVSSSHGLQDLEKPEVRIHKLSELVDFNSKEQILHLPTSDSEEQIINLFKSWKHTLKDYNISISTGPVVAYRSREFIYEAFMNGNVILAPLYWLHNVNKMFTDWPIHRSGKGQYIQIAQSSQSILLPNKNYVLLRRFSAKDDKSRLVASPYFMNPSEPEFIGIENKVNYIYRQKGHLERNEVVGIAAILNSKLFDTYFRTFNGNVNVSSTELREMPMPPIETIREIGNQIILANDSSQSKIDEITFQFFEMNHILPV